jgi:hypothetical protein
LAVRDNYFTDMGVRGQISSETTGPICAWVSHVVVSFDVSDKSFVRIIISSILTTFPAHLILLYLLAVAVLGGD